MSCASSPSLTGVGFRSQFGSGLAIPVGTGKETPLWSKPQTSTGRGHCGGGGPNLNLVERFTVTDPDTLDYEYTVHDPESFVGPWTVAFPFTSDPGPIYEYGCHEGNHSMPLILSAARAEERAAAASR